MLETTVTLRNKVGLHARPAALFVETAGRYPAEVTVVKDGRAVSAKGIIGLLSLGAKSGTRITIRAEGEQAAEALAALSALVEGGFGEA